MLIGHQTADDAGVYLLDGTALVATTDFITPVCDDPVRFGRVAAANSLSDVYAMGGEVLFALNLCCFPERADAQPLFEGILQGAAEKLKEAGGVLLGGHSVRDEELKFGLAVVGRADPGRVLANAGARAGERLVLTKRLGTGVLLNAFKLGKLDEEELEPILAEMELLNRRASQLALEHEVSACTDVTGFGLVGHSLEMARASRVGIRLHVEALPIHDRFAAAVKRGISTGSTLANRSAFGTDVEERAALDRWQRELLFDPQTSGGLLAALPEERSAGFVAALEEAGYRAAEIGEVLEPPVRLQVD